MLRPQGTFGIWQHNGVLCSDVDPSRFRILTIGGNIPPFSVTSHLILILSNQSFFALSKSSFNPFYVGICMNPLL